MRGGIGAILGGLLGGMAGGGIAAAVVYAKADLMDPIATFKLTKTMGVMTMGAAVAGVAVGALVGAQKPEC